MYLLKVLLFLPAAVCLFWIVMNLLMSRRTGTFWILTILSVDLMLFFISDALYATPGISPDRLVYSNLVTLLTGPSVLPLIWMYMDRLRHGRHLRPVHYLWIVVPVALVFGTMTIIEVLGKEAIASFLSDLYVNGPSASSAYRDTLMWHFYLWSSVFFRVVISIELLLGLIYVLRYIFRHKAKLSNLWNYVFNGKPIRVVELQIFNLFLPGIFVLSKAAVFKSELAIHPWIAVAQAIIVSIGFFIFCFTALYGEKEWINNVQASHVMFYNYNKSIKGPIVEIMLEELMEEAPQDALIRTQERLGKKLHADIMIQQGDDIEEIKKKIQSIETGSWDDSLLSRFQHLMLNEQLFLQPSLSLGDIAARLHTNKTYVSKLVNNTYNLSFPELLNTLRIDYAEQYLLHNKNVKQNDVARACGFLSASSFNNVFKKVTGMTPKVWLVARQKQES